MTKKQMVDNMKALATKLDGAADSVNDQTIGTFEAQLYIENFILKGLDVIRKATLSTKG